MPTQEDLLNAFNYDNGKLFWKNSKRPSFNGKEVGSNNGHGYRKVTFENKQYYVHRLIYFMHHGKIPAIIDHIDQNTNNNKISNLRSSNSSTNAINCNNKIRSKTGVRNVSFNKQRNTFCVYIKVNNKSKFIGGFEDLELATLVANEARSKYYGAFNSLEVK